MIEYVRIPSPVGSLTVFAKNGNLVRLSIDGDGFQPPNFRELVFNPENPLLKEAERQLKEYFSGKLQVFRLPLQMEGSVFQRKVWQCLLEIPYGETRSYQDVAERIGNRKAVRAVGQANRNNPLPIIVPCHRVIGKDGSLKGYFGSKTDWKAYLLKLEGFSPQKAEDQPPRAEIM